MTTPTYTDYLHLVAAEDIRPSDIREAAEEAGLTHCAILWTNSRTNDQRITLWQVGDVQVIETNGALIWREDDAESFWLMLAEAGYPTADTCAYRVKMIDRDAPQSWIGLCASVTPINQDSEYCYYTVTTAQPEALEAALKADDDVVSYEIVESEGSEKSE